MVLSSENSSPPQKRCFHTTHYRIIMDITNLSIIELKQLLARVNQDLASIKKANKRSANIKKAAEVSELALCNKIAATFSGNNTVNAPVHNAKLKADIAIQRDILDYLNNGGHIITHTARASKRKPVKALSSTFGALSHNISL